MALLNRMQKNVEVLPHQIRKRLQHKRGPSGWKPEVAKQQRLTACPPSFLFLKIDFRKEIGPFANTGFGSPSDDVSSTCLEMNERIKAIKIDKEKQTFIIKSTLKKTKLLHFSL
ncbi:hypothetical protein AVEN_147993-1 [Araneus ventricosus]|uniref:Uncharacterized protein n=1 Tax=Araneus ventricosus TaxID=182803 RepID=A0A4Y2H527_ARAVE|nr:hypothetical protein AVEN_147993-1 [Araneus ventricosus]